MGRDPAKRATWEREILGEIKVPSWQKFPKPQELTPPLIVDYQIGGKNDHVVSDCSRQRKRWRNRKLRTTEEQFLFLFETKGVLNKIRWK